MLQTWLDTLQAMRAAEALLGDPAVWCNTYAEAEDGTPVAPLDCRACRWNVTGAILYTMSRQQGRQADIYGDPYCKALDVLKRAVCRDVRSKLSAGMQLELWQTDTTVQHGEMLQVLRRATGLAQAMVAVYDCLQDTEMRFVQAPGRASPPQPPSSGQPAPTAGIVRRHRRRDIG